MAEKSLKLTTCSLCGFKFNPDAHTCAGCGMKGGCDLIKCPNCGYEMPPEKSVVVNLVKKLFKKD